MNQPSLLNRLSRRDLFKTGAVSGLAAALGACSRAKPVSLAKKTRSSQPWNVIFCVSDGMSMGIPSLAQPLSQRTRQCGTRWDQLMRDANTSHGLLATASLNSMVTDSAAAASAWGSGSRVNNASLNTLPDGTALTPLAPLLRDAGKRVGLVTTDEICGATPAGFAVCHASRRAYDDIAPQYLDTVDVLMGGGRNNFDTLAREDRRDLLHEFQQAGYLYCHQRGDVLAKPGAPRMLGLFHGRKLPYTIDHRENQAWRDQIPTLAEMTRSAIASLQLGMQGFFLMVEGARIDHAAHRNDIASALWDQLAFDDAVGVALDFAQARDDTLVIVASDHGNSNPGLNGMGSTYDQSTACFDKLLGFKASFAHMRQTLKAQRQHSGDRVALAQDMIAQCTGLNLSGAQASVVSNALLDDQSLDGLNEQHHNWHGTLAQVLGNHTGIQWTGVSHTADHVALAAVGPGSEDFVGLQHHTELFPLITSYAGVSHVNPTAEAQV